MQNKKLINYMHILFTGTFLIYIRLKPSNNKLNAWLYVH